jgi:thiosulfate/3-mercaptopyruvate sulfurtransferase
MTYSPFVSCEELNRHLDDPEWAILDCRYSLADPQWGRKQYKLRHIPGAVYVHLDQDLCGPIIPGKTGRHPLPDVSSARATFSRLGIASGVQVVAYDDRRDGGSAVAARLWWTLRWLGHPTVTILDGGWGLWREQNRLVRFKADSRLARDFTPNPQEDMLLDADDVERIRLDREFRLLDSRSADRYRGEREPIDSVAGHIPGAVSSPYESIFNQQGCFRERQDLREHFSRSLDGIPGERAVFYCGSGVTAAYNLAALEYAGLGRAKLYAGSWSEWITDPERPCT